MNDIPLVRAAYLALDYLDSPNFPHKSPQGADRKPVVAALRMALDAKVTGALEFAAKKRSQLFRLAPTPLLTLPFRRGGQGHLDGRIL